MTSKDDFNIRPYFANGIVYVGPGEYCTLGLLNGKVYDFTQGKPVLINGAPTNVKAVYAGAHHYMFLDSLGNAWGADGNDCGQLGIGNTTNQAQPQKILTDSLGNPFTNIASIWPGAISIDVTGNGSFWQTFFIKTDNTVWVTGATAGGARGNGTYGGTFTTRPVQVNFPAGVHIVKLQPGYIDIALSSTGDVYTWGGGVGGNFFLNALAQGPSPNYFTPTKISLPAPATDIAGGTYWNYALLNNGQLWGWAHENYQDYFGFPRSHPAQNTAQNMTSVYNFPATVKHVFTNTEASYVLLTDGTIWAWGGNAVGTIGNGQEINYNIYCGYPVPYGPNGTGVGCSTQLPYDWDQGQHELQQILPVQIGPGKSNFDTIYTSCNLVYTCWAQDVNGVLYAWGRNKSSEICNGVFPAAQVTGQIQQYYPNSWDVPYITAVDPFSITSVAQVSSPWCVTHPSATGCTVYTIPNVAGPTANAGANQNLSGVTSTTLHGNATSTSNTMITYHIWKQISGPATTLMTLYSDLSPSVTGMSSLGTYVFQLNVTDANWKTDSSRVTVTLLAAPPPGPTVTGGSIKRKRGEKEKFVSH